MADVYPIRVGWPYPAEGGAFNSFQTLVVDGQNEAVAALFVMPQDDTITHVIFTNSAKAGTPTDDSYTVSIQGADASGNPDGTILGGASPASATYPNATYPVAGFGSGTTHIVALANSIALQAGSKYTLVNQKSGATDAVNYLTLIAGSEGLGLAQARPYVLTADTTPTWTKQPRVPFGVLGLRSATRTYGFPIKSLITYREFGGTAELGLSWTLSSGFGASNTYCVRGVRFMIGSPSIATGGTITMTLYTAPTTSPAIAQQALTVDSDTFNAGVGRGADMFFPEDTLTALAPGTKYGIGFAHSAAGSASIRSIELPDAGSRDAYQVPLTYMTRTLTDYPPSGNDTNAFSETTTSIMVAELIISEFAAAASGAGIAALVGGSLIR